MNVIQLTQAAVFSNPNGMQLVTACALKRAEFFQYPTVCSDVGMGQMQYVQNDSNAMAEVKRPHTLSIYKSLSTAKLAKKMVYGPQ